MLAAAAAAAGNDWVVLPTRIILSPPDYSSNYTQSCTKRADRSLLRQSDSILNVWEDHSSTWRAPKRTHDSPFGIQQVTDFFIVDLHVGHLYFERVGLVCLFVDPLKQRAAQPRDQTWMLSITHHGKGLSWTWTQKRSRTWAELRMYSQLKYEIWILNLDIFSCTA